VRDEKDCVCSVCLFRCNILISGKIIKEIPGLVANGTLYTFHVYTISNTDVT
jgi:hypothetical protein